MIYFLGWSLFLIFFKTYLGFKVVGRKNVPRKEAFIFASNHSSFFDPILLGTSIHRSLNYMAKENLFEKPFYGWIMRKLQAFPVNRNEGDLKAIKDALRLLGRGKPLVMFPEGTRSEDGNLKPAKPGIGLIVSRSGASVVPAYIEGSFKALSKGVKTMNCYPVTVYIGEAIKFGTDYLDKKDRNTYQEISDIIMRRIGQLKEAGLR